jgi:hypothetical protein
MQSMTSAPARIGKTTGKTKATAKVTPKGKTVSKTVMPSKAGGKFPGLINR